MSLQPKHIYEFGPYRLDASERLVLMDGEPVPLPPKVFDTLLVLVKNRGRVVEKNELIEQVWPDTFVEENNLSQNISAIRKALGENQDGQKYIETVPRRGYRFVAKVVEDWEKSADLIIEERSQSHILIEEHEEISQRRDYEDASVIEAQASSKFADRLARHKSAAIIILALIVIAGAGVIIGVRRSMSDKKQAVANAPFQAMRLRQLTATGKALSSAISPDGKYVVYVILDGLRQSLWLKQIATDSTVEIIPPAEVNYGGSTFSPDGNYVYKRISKRDSSVRPLYQIPVLGGPPKKLINDLASPVTFSPDGARMAFIRDDPHEKETALLIANADGTAERTLALLKSPDRFSYHGPSWSADGKVIACGAALGGSEMTVVEVRVDDGTIRTITSETWPTVFRVVWLGDGGGLIVSATEEDGTWVPQLYFLSYPDGAARRITNDLNRYGRVSLSLTADSETLVTDQYQRVLNIWTASSADIRGAKQITSGAPSKEEGRWGLCWTPDGRIVYSSNSGNSQVISIMHADGSNDKQLTAVGNMDSLPVVTADGRYIVFQSNRAGSFNIWRMDIDGSNLKQLTTGNDSQPNCSADGLWVVYKSGTGKAATLWKVPVDGGDAVQLTDQPTGWPAVSPDGKLIACSYSDEQADSLAKIAVIRYEGGLPVKLFDIPPTATLRNGIRWTADGRALTYRDSNGGLWSQPLEGGPPKKIAGFETELVYNFAWSHDGKSLAVARGVIISDVVLIRNFR